MLIEEYGLPQEIRSPWIAAISTFTEFVVCGLVPLFPYVARISYPFEASIIMTGTVFFAIGSAKSRWSTDAWWRSGLTTLVVGAIAALLAYGVGLILKGLAE